MRPFTFAMALGAAVLLGAPAASAIPVDAGLAKKGTSVVPTAGGCGIGWHRGPWGGCRPGGAYWGAPFARCWWHPGPWGPVRSCW